VRKTSIPMGRAAMSLLILFGIAIRCEAADAIATKLGHSLPVSTIPGPMVFSPNGNLLAVLRKWASGVDIWDMQRRRLITELPESGTAHAFLGSQVIAFSPDGKLLAMCVDGQDNAVAVYETNSWTKVLTLPSEGFSHAHGCQGLLFTPDSRFLILHTMMNQFQIGADLIFYDTTTWKSARTIRLQPYVDDDRLAYRNKVGCDLTNSIPDRVLLERDDPRIGFVSPGAIALSRDGRYLALSGARYSSCLASPPRLSPNDMKVMEGPNDFEVVIVDLLTNKIARRIPANAQALGFSPDGSKLTIAGATLQLADLTPNEDAEGEETLAVDIGPSADQNGFRYTLNGKYLIVSDSGKISIWDQKHERLLQSIDMGGRPDGIALSPDDKYLAVDGSKASLLDATPLLFQLAMNRAPAGKIVLFELH
jgi:WD40 repeat protein